MIFRLIQSHRYNMAVLERTKRLVRKHFTERQWMIEKFSTDYLNGRDSRQYTELFRKYDVSIELAAIHYFDHSIDQFKRILDIAQQDDVAELLSEMEHGLDQMLLAHLGKASIGNGKIGAALSVFLSSLDPQTSEQTEPVFGPDRDVKPVGEQ